MSHPPSDTSRRLDAGAVRYGSDGLVAAIAQDAVDGRVLMVAWQDAEAIDASLATGELHFHSRSRGMLWRKGETSGNLLRIRAAALDCDGDAVLWTVDPVGPACHTGARSCFDTDGPGPAGGQASQPGAEPGTTQGFVWLETLWATIAERAATRPAGSYTARLLERGVDGPGRKVAEEAVEVLMAAKDDAVAEGRGEEHRDQEALAGEMADLVYHLLVLAAERGIAPSRVIDVLRDRHAT
jgi:phosphoribosyl-ATP pyrophosphohydrolase/phosphoribosyl-AMP cyclohydrolase